MTTPRVIAEFYKNGSRRQIVWAGIGNYEVWLDKRCVLKEVSHEEIIRYLAQCANDYSFVSSNAHKTGVDTFN